jgi:hypothetical protein
VQASVAETSFQEIDPVWEEPIDQHLYLEPDREQAVAGPASVATGPASVAIGLVSVAIDPVAVATDLVSVATDLVSVVIDPVQVEIAQVSVEIAQVSVEIAQVFVQRRCRDGQALAIDLDLVVTVQRPNQLRQ